MNSLCNEMGIGFEASYLVVKILKKKGLLVPNFKTSVFRNRSKQLDSLFSYFDDNKEIAYLNNVSQYFNIAGIEYKDEDFRLFIDGATTHLLAALLYNRKSNDDRILPPVPILYSKIIKEDRDGLALVLNIIKYNDHKWKIICDFKILIILFGKNRLFLLYIYNFNNNFKILRVKRYLLFISMHILFVQQ